jgi:hypothetical protein
MNKKLVLTAGFILYCLLNVQAQCYYIPSTSTNTDSLSYSFSGGNFASYGCAPIDPTYWMNGFGDQALITFVNPQDNPSVRVWGMNDDDSAAIDVNGVAYPLTLGTARYTPKIICGLSPGPDGILFANGLIVGANDNSTGNYSYQDVQLLTTGVNTVKVTGISGAGWGFAGAVIHCRVSTENIAKSKSGESNFTISPNPSTGNVHISFNHFIESGIIQVYNSQGKKIFEDSFIGLEKNLSFKSVPGIYFVCVSGVNETWNEKIIME